MGSGVRSKGVTHIHNESKNPGQVLTNIKSVPRYTTCILKGVIVVVVYG